MQRQIDFLQPVKAYTNDSFNYLALGNQITVHGECKYWWNNCGMAASNQDNDYYHIVLNNLRENNKSVVSYSYNYYDWEEKINNRRETYPMIDHYLSDKLDLVTIQLGDDCLSNKNFKTDLRHLIKHIKAKSEKAQIILVSNFTPKFDIDNIKKEISVEEDVEFADLKEIQDNTMYRAQLGDIVYDEVGKEHIIKEPIVQGQPNDQGMQYIADKIIEKIDIKKIR